tara:strand:+ start:38 stop:637 length:600 start_codon:yes stop_codon:yes gene_type:complete
MSKLNKEFYERSNVLLISRELLGKILCTNYNGKLTSGIIVETEAYAGTIDKASHAYDNKKTNRTKIMYDSGGIAYIYLCYGIHHLFNVVTNSKNIPHAILIRAIEPINGIKTMLTRRKKKNKDYTLTAGPGSLTKALGITINDSGKSLMSNLIWIENQKNINANNVISSPRVGIQYAKDDISNPWRYRIKNNPWTSPAK